MAEASSTADGSKEAPNQDQKPIRPEDQSWYLKELKEIEPEARELFEKYCNISSDDVASHIKQFRDKAFKIYTEILRRVRDGDTFLDIGCCLAQDIRKLVFDGAPSENTYGSDLHEDFMGIGYDLFLDKSTLKTTFIGADLFDIESDLKQLAGKVDIVHTAFFLHLFDLEGQTQAVRRILTLFKDKVGSLVVGRQLGNVEAGLRSSVSGKGKRFRHNAESFTQMWKKVGDETSTEWKVDASLEEEDLWAKAKTDGIDAQFIPPGSRVLNFIVRRVA